MTAVVVDDVDQDAQCGISVFSQYYNDVLAWPTTVDPEIGQWAAVVDAARRTSSLSRTW